MTEHHVEDAGDEFDYTIVYDTYCGWSYGAAPILEAIVESGARVQVVHRYLFQGENAPRIAEGYGEHMAVADGRIEELTGANYSSSYAKNVRGSETEVLESGLSADAAAIVQHLGPSKELELSRRLQYRRFVDGVSAQNRHDVVDTLVDFGIDPADAERIGDPDLRLQAHEAGARAVAAMRRAGAVGVPAVIAHRADHDELIDVAQFYADPTTAAAALREGVLS